MIFAEFNIMTKYVSIIEKLKTIIYSHDYYPIDIVVLD
jgi:hypothetical protein